MNDRPLPAQAGSGLRVVLVRPKTSENVGSVARAMKNFGLSDLVLVAPRCKVDKSAYALAAHAGDLLDAVTIVPTLDDALQGVTWAIGTSARARASEAVREYEPDEALGTLPDAGGALVFGPEDHGLANEELDRCQALLRIPTADYASINLAQAVNVVVHRWFERQRALGEGRVREADPVANPAPRELAERDQVERMYQDLVAMWHEIGFTDEKRETATLRLFRGMLDRAELSKREVAALRGLASQASWAANLPPDRLPKNKGKASTDAVEEKSDVDDTFR